MRRKYVYQDIKYFCNYAMVKSPVTFSFCLNNSVYNHGVSNQFSNKFIRKT